MIGLVLSSRYLRNRMNYVLTSLAIVDCLTGVTTVLWGAVHVVKNIFPTTLECKIVYAIWIFPAINSVLHLAVLTLDRYIAVVYSLRYHSLLTTPRLFGCIVLCWLLSVTMASSIMIGTVVIKSENNWCYIINLPKHYSYLFVLNIGLVMTILICVYVRIYKEIHRQQFRIQSIDGPMAQGSPRQGQSVKVLLLTVGCFIISWWPMLAFTLIAMNNVTYFSESCVIKNISDFADILAIINSAMNPIIYLFRMKTFRKVVIVLFTSLRKCKCAT